MDTPTQSMRCILVIGWNEEVPLCDAIVEIYCPATCALTGFILRIDGTLKSKDKCVTCGKQPIDKCSVLDVVHQRLL